MFQQSNIDEEVDAQLEKSRLSSSLSTNCMLSSVVSAGTGNFVTLILIFNIFGILGHSSPITLHNHQGQNQQHQSLAFAAAAAAHHRSTSASMRRGSSGMVETTNSGEGRQSPMCSRKMFESTFVMSTSSDCKRL